MFLTKQELEELTGYKYYSKQVAWLRHRGYKYEIGRDGKPRVLIRYIESILGYSEKEKKHIRSPYDEPNFDLLEKF